MKKLQQNFTTPEQSKRLLELGVPADSADLYIWDSLIFVRNNKTNGKGFFENIKKIKEEIIPCWSVGRLIEIMEICTKVKYNHNTTLPLLEDVISKLKGWRNSELIDFSKLEE